VPFNVQAVRIADDRILTQDNHPFDVAVESAGTFRWPSIPLFSESLAFHASSNFCRTAGRDGLVAGIDIRQSPISQAALNIVLPPKGVDSRGFLSDIPVSMRDGPGFDVVHTGGVLVMPMV